MKMPSGKGMFIWKVVDCEGGDAAALAARALEAGFGHALIKIADGIWPYNVVGGQDLARPVVDALHGVGLEAWGWQYVYGYNPLGEAAVAVSRAGQLGVDGFVVDAEAEYKQPGKKYAATKYMAALRTGLPEMSIGLSSYRFPHLHPELPWKEFRSKCDFDMPQVYWVFAHNPEEQLEKSEDEYSRMTPARPFAATGAAYKERGWSPSPGEVVHFLDKAKALGISGVNFWEWGNCRRNLPPVWDVIKAYPWATLPPPPPPPPPPPEPFARLRCIRDVRIRSLPDTGDPGNVVGMLFAGDGDEPGAGLYAIEQREIGDDLWARIGWKQWSAMFYNGIRYLERTG